MNRFKLMTLTLAMAAAIPAAAQTRNRRPADYGANGNPARALNYNGTLVYAPYQGYAVAPPAGQAGSYDPSADPFYTANASCDSPVMQQNGWVPVGQTSPGQCRWQKPKTSNPHYTQWLSQQYAAQQQRLASQQQQLGNVRPGEPILRSAVPHAPIVRVPQQTLRQRVGAPGWMPVPNVPGNAVPSWFPTWGQYRNNTNPQ